MDILTREAKEHEQVFESIAFFKQAVKAMSGDDSVLVRKVGDFLQDSIVEHFKFEEAKVFECILRQGTLAEKMFVRELQIEHIDILKQVDAVEDMLARIRDGEVVAAAALRGAVKAAIAPMLKHVRREDARLFTIVKKYQ